VGAKKKQKGRHIMLGRKDPTFLIPEESQHFSPEDVVAMRHAYSVACRERPMSASTEDQRLVLAKAIVLAYKPDLSEDDLVAAVLNLAG
jgi:hypothetical protein